MEVIKMNTKEQFIEWLDSTNDLVIKYYREYKDYQFKVRGEGLEFQDWIVYKNLYESGTNVTYSLSNNIGRDKRG